VSILHPWILCLSLLDYFLRHPRRLETYTSLALSASKDSPPARDTSAGPET